MMCMHKYIFALMNMGQWWAMKLELHNSCCCLELNLDLDTFFHHSITTYAAHDQDIKYPKVYPG